MIPSFVGIDVSKDFLDVFVLPHSLSWRVPNSQDGLHQLLAQLQTLAPSLVVLEPSGGFETEAFLLLRRAGLPLSLVNPRQVRDFARATGQLAKTDRLDARVLAQFAQAIRPAVSRLRSEAQQKLEALGVRRRQLVEMRVAEENRKKRCRDEEMKREIEEHIKWLGKKIKECEGKEREVIEGDEELREKEKLLRSVPGVGKVVSATLLAELGELGEWESKKLAALAGVAPYAKESGRQKGKRGIFGGRGNVRAKLYMAALVGTRCNEVIKVYYEGLLKRGKKKKVALVACMRKLLRILNAILKNRTPWTQPQLG